MYVIAKTKRLFCVTTFALIPVAFAFGLHSTRQTPRVRLPEDLPSSRQAGITLVLFIYSTFSALADDHYRREAVMFYNGDSVVYTIQRMELNA
jgi:hypothetical protein